MKPREQLLAHFQQLQHQNQQLALALEKYRQETEYVCLKTNTHDWPTFLSAIRTGRIAPTNSHPQQTSAIALLDGLFQNASTQRSTERPAFCECESPVCSQGTVRHVKGSDTSRSEAEEALSQPRMCGSVREETVQQILKEIQQYEQQKALSLQGFDTFRKPDSQDLNETAEQTSSKRKEQLSSTRSNRPTAFEQANRSELPFKPVWRKAHKEDESEIHEWKPSLPSNQHLLAMQNTKLRKQLRELEVRFLS